MKVVHRLGSEGYVRTVRGKHGGVVLAQPPGRLRIGALVRDMEEEFNLVECFGTGSHCQIGAVCRLRNSLSQALDAFMRVLNQYTLADLIANRHALRRALHLAPAPAPPKRQRRHSLPSRNDGRQARSTLLP